MQYIWENEIKGSENLWRYLTTERFVNLIECAHLYFAAANQFEDPFEGAVAIQPYDFPIDPRYQEGDTSERSFRELKRLTKINCWHLSDYESNAMWNLYADTRKGVAICSTPDRIKKALQPFKLAPKYGAENLWAGLVRYEDLLKVRLKVNGLERFFYKHQAFSWEREFRLVISVELAEEYGVSIPELGIDVDVSIVDLIENIMLGPALSALDRDLIVDH